MKFFTVNIKLWDFFLRQMQLWSKYPDLIHFVGLTVCNFTKRGRWPGNGSRAVVWSPPLRTLRMDRFKTQTTIFCQALEFDYMFYRDAWLNSLTKGSGYCKESENIKIGENIRMIEWSARLAPKWMLWEGLIFIYFFFNLNFYNVR